MPLGEIAGLKSQKLDAFVTRQVMCSCIQKMCLSQQKPWSPHTKNGACDTSYLQWRVNE